MENQAAAGSIMDNEDRISELPEEILHHHILSLLPQDAAVQTCILSKSWRHLGPTRPNLEFDENSFQSKEIFLSVVENTLQRYDDQKLSVQEFVLSMILHRCSSNFSSNSLLNKWIVKLHMLKRLSLVGVYIEDETFEKIMSSCPSINHLVLNSCSGLSSVKVNKARNLKHFVCEFLEENCRVEINDDAPSLEIIRIKNYQKRFHLHINNNYFFPRLKSLILHYVYLTTELLNNLSSNNCPCLEDLELCYCSGFTVFELSSRSIKRLIIDLPEYPLTKVAIDAANILYFEFRSDHLPSFVSFKTTSSEWRSNILLSHSSDDFLSSTWSLKLHEFLKALSQSQISLVIPPDLANQDTYYDGGSCEPVVVEHLCLKELYSYSQFPTLLNCLFRICRPRYIGLSLYSSSQIFRESQDLEGTSIQVCGGYHPSIVRQPKHSG